MSASTSTLTDPMALRPDGTAVDPAAFRAAALADPKIRRDLRDDPDTAAVLESGDDGALQELLKAVHVVCVEMEAGLWGVGERTRAAVTFDPPPLFFLTQEETRRAEHAARTMSERTIDAQRASAPVPRYERKGE